MKYIDLFAGIGGFHYGINVCNQRQVQTKQADGGDLPVSGVNDVQKPLFTCVYSNEWDKYANSVYRRHYGECDNRDIRTVEATEIPDHDLLCGGFPCQSFSVAGLRRGFGDTKGTLFFEIARIIKEKRPRYLLLENVKGLLSHERGATFYVILSTLDELGYDIQWQVLNTKNFGVPQNRERVYIVGNLRGESRPEVFPIYGTREESSVKRFYRQPLRYLDRNQKNISGDYGYTLDGSGTWGISDGKRVRRLTPTECARLQGFPDDWCSELSDTQQYKCYGNAVTTNVVTEVVKRMML